MNSLYSASSSSMCDSIDGNNLLRSVTINNIHEFEEIVHNNAQRITKPTPPPLYYGIGPQPKEFSVNHLLDEKFIEMPDCDGESAESTFAGKKVLACNCNLTAEDAARQAFATQESYICYLRDKTFRAQRDSTTLRFESKFEGGNLYAAERVKTCSCGLIRALDGFPAVSYETQSNSITLDGINRKKTLFYPWEQVYMLFLQADSNSTSHSQWFCFTIENMLVNTEYTFILPNFVKKSSSYNQGMQILFADVDGDCKWYKEGFDIIYKPNRTFTADKAHFLYKYSSLCFKVTFSRKSRFLVAYHYPYTYSKAYNYLNRQIVAYNAACPSDYLLIVKPIYQTPMGNDIDVVTITQREFDGVKAVKQRSIMVITARIHPGESYSSYIFEGIMDFLLSDEFGARQLRENYIIKLVPMLNPDGVIIGNYRCNYNGVDLNRKWHMSSQAVTPEIYAVHQLLQELVEQNNRVDLFIDIHGHFKKANVFAYSTDKQQFLQALDYNSAFFSLRDCQFGVGKGKEHTGRVECQTRYKIPVSICVESSFHKISKGQSEQILSQQLLRSIGADIARNLLFLVRPDLPQFKIREELSIGDFYDSGSQYSDDSGEDIDVFKENKARKRGSYMNYIRKNIGAQLLTKETAQKQYSTNLPPKNPKRAAKKPGGDFFSRMAQPMKTKSLPLMSDDHERLNSAQKRPTATEQQQATQNLLRTKRPQSSTVAGQQVRIIYEHTFDLQQERIAFERQFYRPKIPVCQLQQRQWTDAAKRAEAIRLIRSRGYDVIPQKFDLE